MTKPKMPETWRYSCNLRWMLHRPRAPWPFGMRAGAFRRHFKWHHQCGLHEGHETRHQCEDCGATR